MTDEERLITFINSFNPGNTPFLNELERYAKETNVPVIRPSMQSFIKVILSLKKPKKILEVGTAIGFSALLMAQYNPVSCHITTIENYEKRIPLAKENFKKAGMEDIIKLIEGDAAEILPALDDAYDLIFMDAAKGQYIHFLPDIVRLLAPEGVLISDNVLQEGNVLRSRFAVVRRDRTIHSRMRDYLFALSREPELTTDILPVGDGITFSVKRKITENKQ